MCREIPEANLRHNIIEAMIARDIAISYAYMQQNNKETEKSCAKVADLPGNPPSKSTTFIGAPMRDPSLFLAKKMAEPVPSTKSEKDPMPGPSSDKLANHRLLSGSLSSLSLSSTEDEDHEELIMNGSLTFPSEDRYPVGSEDCEKNTTHFSDASPEPEEGKQNTSDQYQSTVDEIITRLFKLHQLKQHFNDKNMDETSRKENDDRQQQLDQEINSLEDYLFR